MTPFLKYLREWNRQREGGPIATIPIVNQFSATVTSMSVALKPLTIDSTNKQLDSKQKKFHSNVSKALERFDTVTEWADYIASLGALLKALQSWSPKFQNVKYYVPFPYQVSRRLTSSLSPNLPAGVHQKTLEVYTYIFENIGIEILAVESNIWIPGILPLMSFASMSVKSYLIDLYDTYLVQLPSLTLKMLIRPLLASLLPGIDDESSEFLPLTLKLIETLKENLDDDSLFWQTCFLIVATNKDRRLGGMVWLMKKFPSLNAVPHLVKAQSSQEALATDTPKSGSQIDVAIEKKKLKEQTLSTLLPVAKDLVTPEPGILVRCFIRCLDDDNDVLIKRNILDLLLQRLHLDSPVIKSLISTEDRKLLIFKCCQTTLNKDMSLNRRIWNWLLGFTSSGQGAVTSTTAGSGEVSKDQVNSNEYFRKNGLQPLLDSLEDHTHKAEDLVTAFKICITFLDKWEIGSLVVPEVFIKLLLAAQTFSDNESVMKASVTFFDAVETNIIWGKIFHYIKESNNFDFLKFVLSNFHIASDEEIIVRHLPMIIVTILSYLNGTDDIPQDKEIQMLNVLSQLLEFTPERAYLPLSHSQIQFDPSKTPESILEKIETFYSIASDPKDADSDDPITTDVLPFTTEDITLLIAYSTHCILLKHLDSMTCVNEVSKIFIQLFEIIPEQNETEQIEKLKEPNELLTTKLFDILSSISAADDSNQILGVVDLYSSYISSRIDIISSVRLLNKMIQVLWGYMIIPFKQHISIKCLKSFERTVPSKYIASGLASAFVQERNFLQRMNVLDLLWTQLDSDNHLIETPLQLVLDELFDRQSANYLTVSKWVLSIINAGTTNRLYQILTDEILNFAFLTKETLDQFDDLEMFTYKVRILTAVLKTSDGPTVRSFASELTVVNSPEKWKNEDISTYKNLTIIIALRFLQLKNNNNTKSIRSILILLDTLLDGSEVNFKDIVILLLQMSSRYISTGGSEAELIAVSLLDIVSKVLRLSHENGIKLDIFDDNSTHLKYVDYLVTSLSSMNTPLIITSYVKILSESIVYFGESIFHVILPLTASIVQCISRLFTLEKTKGGYYQPIALLLEGLENLLQVSHGYLGLDGRGGSQSINGQRNDFLQSVVSNVFYTENPEDSAKSQGERDVVLQSFKQVSLCCIEIWSWAHNASDKSDVTKKDYSSYKFKFRAKRLLETLYSLEPLETIENLITIDSDDILTLIHVIDGNKPSLTIPYLFHGIVIRYDRHSTVKFSFASTKTNQARIEKYEPSLLHKLDGFTIMNFLIRYTHSLENSAVEEIYGDFIIFFKEITLNYNLFKPIYLEIIDFVGIVANKLSLSQIGEQKKYRKELSDIFMRYMPNVMNDAPPTDKVEYENLFKKMRNLVKNTESIVNDHVGSDKFNTVISTIVGQYLSPDLKNKNAEHRSEVVLSLALEVSKVGSKIKSWKTLLSDIFNDDNRFQIFGPNETWSNVIFTWSNYPENKSKLLNELLLVTGSKKTGMTPSLITFNSWTSAEITTRCQNLLRISYLLLISPMDTYLLDFQSLISCVCQYLVSNETEIKKKCWILLRTLLLTFHVTHFNEYWSMISYCLQTNLQQFYEQLQIQEEIDSNEVLQICKTLDLLLSLDFEGFSATNEWLFIIDTINCVHRAAPFVALVDEIAELKDFEIARQEDIDLAVSGERKLPLLCGVHEIKHYTQLHNFVHHLSYEHYESVYSMKEINIVMCKDDVLNDVFS